MWVRIPPGTHFFPSSATAGEALPLRKFGTLLALIAAAVIAFGWLGWKCLRDPKINFFPRDNRAEWIVFPAPVDARTHRVATMDATFRRTFTLPLQPTAVQLLIRPAKRLELKINDETVQTTAPHNWKKISTLDIARLLRTGPNTIEVRVFNDDAPPALWLRLDADSSTLQTDKTWEVSVAGSAWRNCALASVPRHPDAGNLLGGGERVTEVF